MKNFKCLFVFMVFLSLACGRPPRNIGDDPPGGSGANTPKSDVFDPKVATAELTAKLSPQVNDNYYIQLSSFNPKIVYVTPKNAFLLWENLPPIDHYLHFFGISVRQSKGFFNGIFNLEAGGKLRANLLSELKAIDPALLIASTPVTKGEVRIGFAGQNNQEPHKGVFRMTLGSLATSSTNTDLGFQLELNSDGLAIVDRLKDKDGNWDELIYLDVVWQVDVGYAKVLDTMVTRTRIDCVTLETTVGENQTVLYNPKFRATDPACASR